MYGHKQNVIGEIENRITVEMSEEDAASFVKFRRFQSIFETLEMEGAVDVKNGSVTLHFDKFGKIRTIQVVRNYMQ